MTRKTKAQRINLRGTKDRKLQQVWILAEDHKNLPSLAEALKAAHPGTDFGSIAAVIHASLEATRTTLGLKEPAHA